MEEKKIAPTVCFFLEGRLFRLGQSDSHDDADGDEDGDDEQQQHTIHDDEDHDCDDADAVDNHHRLIMNMLVSSWQTDREYVCMDANLDLRLLGL